MAYREIQPGEIDIYEPGIGTIKQKKKFSLDNIHISSKELWDYCIWGGLGLLIVWIGATNAGSYYMSGTRMGEPLSTFFYTWQMGTVLIVVGCLMIYHRFLGSGRKP